MGGVIDQPFDSGLRFIYIISQYTLSISKDCKDIFAKNIKFYITGQIKWVGYKLLLFVKFVCLD